MSRLPRLLPLVLVATLTGAVAVGLPAYASSEEPARGSGGPAPAVAARAAAAPVALPAPDVEPARCPLPEPSTAAGWQAAFEGLNDASWSGGDQGSSLRLPDGRVMWVFADSFLGAEEADGSRAAASSFVHSTLVLSDGGCLTGVTGPGGTSLVPDAPDGQFYWPQHAFFDGGRLLLPVLRVRALAAGEGVARSFVTTGSSLAELRYAPGETPEFLRLHDTPSADAPDTAVHWGAAVAHDGAHTYLYGTRKVDAPQVFGKALSVARFAAGAATTPAAWEFWDGRNWSSDPAAAATVKSAVGGVSTSLSVWRAGDGTWRAVTKKDDFLGDEIVLLTAPAPTGPWAERVLGASPSYAVPGETTYTALAHPHLPLDGGGLLVSVSRNHDAMAAHLADADLYKPQFR